MPRVFYVNQWNLHVENDTKGVSCASQSDAKGSICDEVGVRMCCSQLTRISTEQLLQYLCSTVPVVK